MFKAIRLRRANQTLCHAIRHGEIESVRKALRNGADTHQLISYAGEQRSLLSVCLQRGDAACLKALLDHGATLPSDNVEPGLQALSAPSNHLALLSRLLEAGLNPNADEGALFFACLEQLSEPDATLCVTRLIAHGGDINSRNHAGETPLSVALRNEQSQLAATLVSSGAHLPENLDSLPCSDAIKLLARRNAEDLRVRRLLQGLN